MIQLKQILENTIMEEPLADILSSKSEYDGKINVLFIGDAETGINSSYANLLINNEAINGDIVTKENADTRKLFRLLRSNMSDKYDIISIMPGNEIDRSVRITIRLLEEIFKFAKSNGKMVIAITNPITDSIKPSKQSKINDLKEVSDWIANQNITDYVLDLGQLSSGYFEKTGTELTQDGHKKLAEDWLDIVEDYEFDISDEIPEKEPKTKTVTATTSKTDATTASKGSGTFGTDSTYSTEIVDSANFSDSLSDQATYLIAKFEGFNAEPKWDVNNWRIGHGSSTVTTSAGKIIRLSNKRSQKPNLVITRDDAARDLKRRLENEFIPETLKDIGSTASILPDGVLAALVSIAYNYGSLPNSVRSATRTADIDAIANSIRNRQSDNGGINKKRRNKEADYVLRAGNESITVEYVMKIKKLLKKG